MKAFAIGIAGAAVLTAAAWMSAAEGECTVVREQYTVGMGKPLTVELEVTAGEVILEKSGQADLLTVTLEYTPDEFRPKLDFDEGKNRLFVRLRKKDWHHVEKSDSCDRDWAKVVVGLPESPELYLDTRLKAGEAVMRLGGLSIKEANLTQWAGEFDLEFAEPNRIVMDYLEIDAKVGEVDLRSLGNARYKDADINAGIGELTADFHGAMESDSHTRIDLDIGETTVILPADIAVRLSVGGMFSFLSEKNITGSLFRRGRFYYSENYDASQTRCAFTVTPGLGQLDIQRQP